jgi:hypothetical protein
MQQLQIVLSTHFINIESKNAIKYEPHQNEKKKSSFAKCIGEELTREVVAEFFESAQPAFDKTQKVEEERIFFRRVYEPIEKTKK